MRMEGEEDLIFRPLLRGLCKYESLIDGTLSLFDVARMNHALDVEAENKHRMTPQ